MKVKFKSTPLSKVKTPASSIGKRQSRNLDVIISRSFAATDRARIPRKRRNNRILAVFLDMDLISRIESFCESSSSSLSFVDSSYRRNGHAELRVFSSLLQSLDPSSLQSLSTQNCSHIIKIVLPLLWPPFTSSIDRLDALPLPSIEPPLPPPSPPPLLNREGRLSATLRAHSYTSGQLSNVPLAFDIIAPSLSSPRRSDAAFRAAAVISRGGDSSSLTESAAGVNRLQDNSLFFSWAMQAPLALDLLQITLSILIQQLEQDYCQPSSSKSNFDSSLIVDVLCACGHFLCYAPWTFPDAHKAAQKVVFLLSRLCSLVRKGEDISPQLPTPTSSSTHKKDENSVCSPISQMSDLHYIVGIHADALLEYCRSRSVGGRWKSEATNEPIRYLTLLVVTSLRTLPHDRLSLCIPLGLRLSDDPEPENTWLGVSILCHILSVALPTDLRTHPFCSPLIKEAIERADICGGIRQHPTVAHALSHLTALSLSVLYGTPAQTAQTNKQSKDNDELLRILSRGPSPPQQSCLDEPHDVAVYTLLKKLSLSSSSHVQYVVLDAFGNALVSAMGCRIARHLSRIAPALMKLVSQTGDARVAAAALSVLNECIIAAPSRFSVSSEEEAWIMASNGNKVLNETDERRFDRGKGENEEEDIMIDALSRSALQKTVIDACTIASKRINREENEEEEDEGRCGYTLPCEDKDGLLTWSSLNQKERKSGDELVQLWINEVRRNFN